MRLIPIEYYKFREDSIELLSEDERYELSIRNLDDNVGTDDRISNKTYINDSYLLKYPERTKKYISNGDKILILLNEIKDIKSDFYYYGMFYLERFKFILRLVYGLEEDSSDNEYKKRNPNSVKKLKQMSFDELLLDVRKEKVKFIEYFKERYKRNPC